MSLIYFFNFLQEVNVKKENAADQQTNNKLHLKQEAKTTNNSSLTKVHLVRLFYLYVLEKIC